MAEVIEDSLLEAVLNNPDLYLPSQIVLDLTAGQGVAMTSEQSDAHAQNKKKRKTWHITCGGFYHKNIYDLANKIQEIFMSHAELFPRMPKRQKTDRIHPIGVLIMSSRRLSARADIHNITDDSFKNLLNLEVNKNKNEFYYLSIRDLLRKLHQVW